MTEPRRFPYGGVPVYNPQSLSKGEALAQFHARQAAYLSLMDLLHEERPSHVLIIGTRGMGKTTLLQRVHYGVEDDAELNGRYLVLAFPEEQYNVNRLHHFLLNTVDALADAMERLRNERMLTRVEAYAEMVGKLSQEEIEERVPKFLAEIGQEMGRNLLLLVDNADRLFDTIEKQEQWRLRELLSSRRDLTLFGATTQASEGIYGTDRAFFEFFQIHRLTPLTFVEVRDLLLRLSESVEERGDEKGAAKRRVEEWLAADAARLRTLVQLTGGNPRTTVLLFHLVLDGLAGGAREYLEQLLDQCTPNYKGRVDELPAQAQQVLDAVALRWDPVTAMEVGEDTGLETNAVSTQLTRLVRQGILEKADPGDSKKALYQVAERFFNIWYLMRASRRVRAKLRWFVEFLRVFFDSGELEEMAWERLEKFRSGRRRRPEEIETAFAYVLASGANRQRFEAYLKRKCAYWEAEWRPYVESIPCPEGDVVSGQSSGDVSPATHPDAIEALQRAVELEPDSADNWRCLGRARAQAREFIEAEGALRRAITLDPTHAWCWNRLGDVLDEIPERKTEAEAAYRKAIEIDPTSAWFWADLGDVLDEIPERKTEAEAAYRKAIALEPQSAWLWNKLGATLTEIPERREDAQSAIRKAIDLDPNAARPWNLLGDILSGASDRKEEAEAAYRKAIEIDPKCAWFWSDLGDFLSEVPERREEAEAAYRKAIEIDPKCAWSWSDLGGLLSETPERREEAEVAIRKGIDLDPKDASLWADLGYILQDMPGRRDEAEVAFRNALEKDSSDGYTWGSFGFFLACKAENSKEAGVALRKSVELEPDHSGNLRNLGVLLFCKMNHKKQALQYIRRAHQLRTFDPASLPVSAAILAACVRESESEDEQLLTFTDASHGSAFWDELLRLCRNYPPFGKILIGICDMVQQRDNSNEFARLHRAVALAQLGDFPRASVALEDALAGDPIEQLSVGRRALEVFFAAAVRNGRVRDCRELLDKKEWKDAWRPIYEALRAVEEGSGEYLKRVAVEIREPALVFLRRIAPELPGLPALTS